MNDNPGIIGCDLDCCLAYWDSTYGPLDIGPPIPPMVDRIKRHMQQGHKVVIFTARAAHNSPHVIKAIEEWCRQHLGAVLPVTAVKWPNMFMFYDDRARQVVPNKGELID